MTGNRFHLFRLRHISGEALLELLVASGIFLIITTSIITLVMGSRSLVLDTSQASAATTYAEEGLEAVRLLRDQAWSNITDGTYGLVQTNGNWQLSGASDVKGPYTRRVTISSNSSNSKTVTSRVTWQALPTRTPAVSLATVLTNWKTTQQDNFLSGDWTHPVTAGTADVDSGAQGTDVKVENGLVYLSSSASQQSKPDLTIFNVDNPNAPVKLSSVDLGVSNITQIAKSSAHVFGAIAGSLDEYLTVNVSNPSSPTKVNSQDLSSGKSLSAAVSGSVLYIGTERLTGEPEFFAINIANPTSPQVLGSFEVNGNVTAIVVANNRAYITTSIDNAEMMVLDVSNPAAMTQLGQFNAAGTEDGTSIFIKDEFNIYLGRELSSINPEFYILNASNPASVTVRGSMNLAARVNDMVAVNHLVFMVTEQPNAEFRILDVANPSSIYSYASLNFPQNATGIDYENNTIYCSVRSNSALRIIRSG